MSCIRTPSWVRNLFLVLSQGQESKYAAKVDEVKAEHEKLLQEAFERAKVVKFLFPTPFS